MQHEPLLQWGALRLPLTLVLLAGDSAGGSMLGGQEVTTEGPPTWPSGPFPPSSLAQPHPQLLPLSGPCDLDLSLSHTRRVRNKLLPSSWQAVLGLLGHLNPSRKFLWVSEWAAYRPSPGLRSLEAPPNLARPPPHHSLFHVVGEEDAQSSLAQAWPLPVALGFLSDLTSPLARVSLYLFTVS